MLPEVASEVKVGDVLLLNEKPCVVEEIKTHGNKILFKFPEGSATPMAIMTKVAPIKAVAPAPEDPEAKAAPPAE